MNAKKKRIKDRRKARKLMDQAWDSAADGNGDLAVKIARRAVAHSPGNPMLWMDEGLLLIQAGEDDAAARSFQTALGLAPTLAEAYAQLAAIRLRQGFITRAVALQEQAAAHAAESERYAEALAAYRAMAGQTAAPTACVEDEPASSMPDMTCPIEQSLRAKFPAISKKVDSLDRMSLIDTLTERGIVHIREFLSEDACQSLRSAFHDDDLFAETVVMDKARFGLGCYRYFKAPIPEIVDALRRIVFPPMATIANRWQQMVGKEERFPLVWEGLRVHCAEFDQSTPTPILLRYEQGGFNDLHQDIRGQVFFPIQLAIVLSPQRDVVAGDDVGFTGGEFLFTDSGKKRARPKAIPAGLGDAILFCTHSRLVKVAGVYGLQPVKHGVAEVTSGTRYVLGVPFHEYA